MTDRDHFAAAALTGLLFHNYEPPKPISWWVEQAYDYADAMLRERGRTNHDAAPAAKAQVDAAGISRQGAGDTQKPVAWALTCGNCVDSTFTDRDEAVEWASGIIPPPQIVPLYGKPQPTLTDEEREAVAYYVGTGGPDRVDAILRGLLERLK